MNQDQENNIKRERINAMKNKIIINESDDNSITVTGTEKNKVKVNEQNRKKVELSELNLLTPEEKEKLAQQKGKDTDDENEKIGKADRNDSDRAKADWKRDKLIEYTDIIDFLFKEIIVEGLDWSLNKVVNAATFTTAWAVDGILNAASHAKDALWDDIKSYLDKRKEKQKEEIEKAKIQAPKDKTGAFANTVADIHKNKTPQQGQSVLTDTNKKIIEGVAGFIRRGEYNNLKFMSPETLNVIQKTDPQKLNEILSPDNMKTLSASILYTAEMADLYSTNMASARMLTEKAKDGKAYDGMDEQKVFDMLKLEARKEFTGLVNHSAQNGNNIPEAAQSYFETSVKANQYIRDEIQKGNYQENGKQPASNPYMEKLDKDIAAAKDTPYTVQTGMIEMAEEMTSRQENLAGVKDTLEKREALIEARKADLAKRRDQFRQACAKSKNPILAQKAQTGQLHTSQMGLDKQKFKQMQRMREQTK